MAPTDKDKSMRNIDPRIFKDEFIGNQSPWLRLLWIGMVDLLADDQGRMLDEAAVIKISLFPYDLKVTALDIESYLKLLSKHKKILRFQSKDGRSIIQIINWWRYQSSAQWSGRSLYQAPPKWTDRIKSHERGHGSSVIMEHWNETGGFNSKPTTLGDKVSHKVSDKVIGKGRREDEDEDEDEDEENIKDLPTIPTLPPSQAQAGKVGKVQNKTIPRTFEDQCKSLNKKQKTTAELIHKVFASYGLRDPKLSSMSVIVATRNYNGTLRKMLLAAIASAQADENAKNKPIIAAHRLEQKEIPAQYFNRKEWTGLPHQVLEALGIPSREDDPLGQELRRIESSE
jgi:hypothetical protein